MTYNSRPSARVGTPGKGPADSPLRLYYRQAASDTPTSSTAPLPRQLQQEQQLISSTFNIGNRFLHRRQEQAPLQCAAHARATRPCIPGSPPPALDGLARNPPARHDADRFRRRGEPDAATAAARGRGTISCSPSLSLSLIPGLCTSRLAPLAGCGHRCRSLTRSSQSRADPWCMVVPDARSSRRMHTVADSW
jgi:hypothetical protein